MTTPKAILIASLGAIAAFLYFSLQPSYSYQFFLEKGGYMKVNTKTGELHSCEVVVQDGGILTAKCKALKENLSKS
jgi:hypothetical protein